MNKRLKRLAATVLTLVMLVSAFAAQMITSYAAAGKITFSDPTVTVGNQAIAQDQGDQDASPDQQLLFQRQLLSASVLRAEGVVKLVL